MSESGLDGRHRDKNGEIARKHGNTLVGTLRKIYGSGFAPGYAETTKLVDVLHALDEPSLHQLVHRHQEGSLESGIKEAEAKS